MYNPKKGSNIMRQLISAVALALTFAAPIAYAADPPAAPAPAAQTYKYKTPKLGKSQIDDLLTQPAKLLIIDVRRPDELTKIGSFPVYLSIQPDQLEKSLAYIPKDRKIITVSNHAGRAGAAADLLAAHGFKVAGAVGIENYAEEGGAVTKIAPPASTASNP